MVSNSLDPLNMANILTDLTDIRRKDSPERVAYRYRDDNGIWQPRSWEHFAEDVDNIAYALETLGLSPSEMLARIGVSEYFISSSNTSRYTSS